MSARKQKTACAEPDRACSEYSERVFRAYRAFCAVGGLLLHEREEVGLLSKVCQVFVNISGYRMAWIAYADEGVEKLVRPVAYAGFEEGYLHAARITWGDTPTGNGPSGVAIRTGRPAVNQHIRTDPLFTPWREEAVRRGYESSAAFPMLAGDGHAFGALALYAPEPDAFGVEELQVVSHLVHLLAYGVLSIRSAQQLQSKLTDTIDIAAELQGVLDNMLESVFVCDSKGHIVLTNRSGLLLLGCSTTEEARTFSWASTGGFLPRTKRGEGDELCPLERALRGEVVTHYQERLQPPGKTEIVVSTTSAPIRNRGGEIIGAVKVVRDITDLAEFEKMKDQFVEVAAHELKTPVTAIKGYCQFLLRNQEPLSERARALLTEIDLGTVRIDRIVRDLLDLSQLHFGDLPIHLESMDLSELVRQVVIEESNRSRDHKISIGALVATPVDADRQRIGQVVRSLIENAIKYSPEGGKVEVQLQITDGLAVFSVRDEGVGIPKAHQLEVFQRFYRAHPDTPFEHGGLGVSLYLCKQIIQRHQGQIWFESKVDRGSTFKFSIPLDRTFLEGEGGKSRDSHH